MMRVANRGICVIDLHRHPIAYYFYTTIGRLILHNRLLREDGALSIRRSFEPKELLGLARRAELATLTWNAISPTGWYCWHQGRQPKLI